MDSEKVVLEGPLACKLFDAHYSSLEIFHHHDGVVFLYALSLAV